MLTNGVLGHMHNMWGLEQRLMAHWAPTLAKLEAPCPSS